MKKILSKRVLVICILSSIALLASQAFATSPASTNKEMMKKHSPERNKTKARNSGAGCMACHQNETALPNQHVKKTG